MANYEAYKCTDCGVSGFKLWRDYGYCDELWCALCCEKRIAEKAREPDPWEDPPGPLNMMRYGFSGVAAIPVDDDLDAYQSAGAFKAEGLLWWHALPTFNDERREIETVMHTLRKASDDLGREERAERSLIQKVNGLRGQLGKLPLPFPKMLSEDGYGYRRELESARAVMLEMLGRVYAVQARRLELYQQESDLRWTLERKVVELIEPHTVTIWGTKTETHDLGNGKVLRISGGEEQPMELSPGQRIALGRTGTAVVLLGESYRDCPTIMDYGQDGQMLIDELQKSGKVFFVWGQG